MASALRPCVATGVALLGGGLLTVAPIAESPAAPVASEVRLLNSDITDTANGLVGLIVGGTSYPIPPASYVHAADELYIQRILPGAQTHAVFTPEGASPLFSGVKSLPFDTSIAQGREMVDTYITNEVAAGNTVAVYGMSQSATIEGSVMDDLKAAGVPADAVKFVLLGDPSNPAGGLWPRLDGLTLPALGMTFGDPTPSDSIYETSIYTLEYDGFADFPKYTMNALADLNALLGMFMVHQVYRDLDPAQVDNAIELPTSTDYDGATTYYMMPWTGDLPLLAPLRALPLIGTPLADLLQPVLTQVVNLGYDNPDNLGWDAGPADVASGLGVFPSSEQFATFLANLGPAAQQGFSDFAADLSHLSFTGEPIFGGGGLGAGGWPAPVYPLDNLGDWLNALTGAASQLYSNVLPAVDVALSMAVSLPVFDANLFLEHLDNPIDAIGLPIAATTAIGLLGPGIEFASILQSISGIAHEFSGAM